MRALAFFYRLFRTAQRASFALRGAFLLQTALMAINNLLFFATFWLLLRRFDNLRGYRLPDMLLLEGVSAAGFGIAVVTCGGVLELARSIGDGELDALLAQPKSVLIRAIASRSLASGWGDVVSGAALYCVSGYGHPLAALGAVSLAAVGFAASGVVMNCAAFWLGRTDQLSRTLFEFVVAFTCYPPTLFGGSLRILLFTLIPAGIVAYLPVELVRSPSLAGFGGALGATIAYALFARWLFQRGLRRYESGSRFVGFG